MHDALPAGLPQVGVLLLQEQQLVAGAAAAVQQRCYPARNDWQHSGAAARTAATRHARHSRPAAHVVAVQHLLAVERQRGVRLCGGGRALGCRRARPHGLAFLGLPRKVCRPLERHAVIFRVGAPAAARPPQLLVARQRAVEVCEGGLAAGVCLAHQARRRLQRLLHRRVLLGRHGSRHGGCHSGLGACRGWGDWAAAALRSRGGAAVEGPAAGAGGRVAAPPLPRRRRLLGVGRLAVGRAQGAADTAQLPQQRRRQPLGRRLGGAGGGAGGGGLQLLGCQPGEPAPRWMHAGLRVGRKGTQTRCSLLAGLRERGSWSPLCVQSGVAG